MIITSSCNIGNPLKGPYNVHTVLDNVLIIKYMFISGSRLNLRSYWILQDRILLRWNTVEHAQCDLPNCNILLEVKEMINIGKRLIEKSHLLIT